MACSGCAKRQQMLKRAANSVRKGNVSQAAKRVGMVGKSTVRAVRSKLSLRRR